MIGRRSSSEYQTTRFTDDKDTQEYDERNAEDGDEEGKENRDN